MLSWWKIVSCRVLKLCFFSISAGALVLPEKKVEENEVDFLRELPGEKEYYRTSTEANDFVPTTYSGDGSGAEPIEKHSGNAEGGSGDTGLAPPAPENNPDLYTYYFVRVNIDGEETNETDRQWLDFLQNNGVDLSKIHGGGGNFGVANLMPRDDLTENNPAITMLEDGIQAETANETAAPTDAEPKAAEMKTMRVLNAEPSDVPMEVPEDEPIDQFNSTMYEFVNETNIYRPSDESVDAPEISSPDGSIDGISLISRGGEDTSNTNASSDDEGEESSTGGLNLPIPQIPAESESIDAIIKRYKVLRGWTFAA